MQENMAKIKKNQKSKGRKSKASGSRRRRSPGIALVLLLFAALGGYVYFSSPVNVTVARVAEGPAVETVKAVGQVEPVEDEVRAPVSGRIISMDHAMGTEVLEGEPLATMEGSGNGKKIVVFAPSDGVVHSLFEEIELEKDRLINAGTPLFAIRICCDLRVFAEVMAAFMPRLAVGQDAEIESEAYSGPPVKGKLVTLTPLGKRAKDPYRVLISLPLGAPYQDGDEVAVAVAIQRQESALLVPARALVNNQVWVVIGKRVFARAVSVGMVNDLHAQITFGLEKNDVVVVNPSGELRESGRVKITRTILTLKD